MLVGAVAVAALWVAALGAFARGRGDEAGGAMLVLGARGFVVATAVEVVLGLWWALALPGDGWRLMVGGDLAATHYVVVSLLLAIGAAMVMWCAPGAQRPLRRVVIGAAHIVVVVVLMVFLRDVVRRDTLAGRVDFEAMATDPQWGAIVSFLVLLVAGLVTIAWMVRRVITARRG